MIFVSSLEFQVGLCPYVTAAVRGGSLRASRTWSQRPKFVQGSLESVEHLAPPSPPSLPRSFFAFWGFPEILRITPLFLGCVPGRLFVAGNTFLSFPFLSLSLSFLLSFLSSPFSLGVPGCFVIAGSPSFWCVPGRMCRSWEHLCFLLSFPLFSSSPCPLFPRAQRVYKQTRLLQQVVSNEVWFVIGLSPFIWFPFHRPPQTFFFLFSFMSFCLHVSSSSSFLSLARTIVRTLVCTHTRTRTLLTARFRWPRFVTMRFGSSVVPLHLLGSFSSATTHTFVCLVLLIFICPFCVHMCLPPFRAGWRSHMPPFGEACVCNPWNHRDPFGLFSLLVF